MPAAVQPWPDICHQPAGCLILLCSPASRNSNPRPWRCPVPGPRSFRGRAWIRTMRWGRPPSGW